MEILEQNFNYEDQKFTKANYVYYSPKFNLTKNEFGYLVTSVKLNNGENYWIVLESSSYDRKYYIETVYKKELQIMQDKKDVDFLEFLYEENKADLVKFKDEAYFMVVNTNDPGKTKYVFTDYLDAINFLKRIDQKKD